jgi:hypothetical protein
VPRIQLKPESTVSTQEEDDESSEDDNDEYRIFRAQPPTAVRRNKLLLEKAGCSSIGIAKAGDKFSPRKRRQWAWEAQFEDDMNRMQELQLRLVKLRDPNGRAVPPAKPAPTATKGKRR